MRRKHYLIVYLVILVLVILIGVAERMTQTRLAVFTVLVIAALVPSSVRRLHDIDFSGWYVIAVILIPFATILLLALPGVPTSNAFGANPRTSSN